MRKNRRPLPRSLLQISPLLLVLACDTVGGNGREFDTPPGQLKNNDPDLAPNEALIKGLMRDAVTKLPVANLEIQVQSLGKSDVSTQNATTDAKGRFVIVVPAGRYQLFTGDRGCTYRAQASEVEAHQSGAANVALFLEPLPAGSSCTLEKPH